MECIGEPVFAGENRAPGTKPTHGKSDCTVGEQAGLRGESVACHTGRVMVLAVVRWRIRVVRPHGYSDSQRRYRDAWDRNWYQYSRNGAVYVGESECGTGGIE